MDLKFLHPTDKTKFQYPLFAYYIAQGLNLIKTLICFLDKVETLILSRKISKYHEGSNIYITGLARAGTTIVL